MRFVPKQHALAAMAATLLTALSLLSLAGRPALGFESQLQLEIDPPYHWLDPISLSWDETGQSLDSLSLTGQVFGYGVRAGVVPVSWGPSPEENLLLAGRQGLPMVWVSRGFSGFEIVPAVDYDIFYAKLPPRDSSDRYLVGRRASFGNERWRAGVTEVAVLSGDFSLFYLNPYPFFPLSVTKVFLTETGKADPRDANLLYSLELRYTGDRMSGYAVLLVDEAPLTPAWNGPFRLGLQVGGQVKGWLGHDDLELWGEYTAISRYTFTCLEGFARGDFYNDNEPIGHSLGPDADLLRVRLSRSAGDRRMWLELAQERHGEGRFGDRWDPSIGQVLEFLTGTVETSWGLNAGIEFTLADRFTTELSLGAAWVMNQNNLAGVDGWTGQAALGIVWKM